MPQNMEPDTINLNWDIKKYINIKIIKNSRMSLKLLGLTDYQKSY